MLIKIIRLALAFRGTSEMKDIATDIHILKGQENEQQFQEANSMYNNIRMLYQDYSIEATGHSKGGSLALYLNKRYGIKCEVFNAGIGGGVFQSNPNKDKAILHIIKGDPISNLGTLGNLGTVKLYEAKSENPHSLSNFF